MDCFQNKKESKLELIVEKLKNNVNKNTFLTIVLEAIGEFKKTDYINEEVRDFFYNLVFETIFSINEDNSYVSVYILFFKKCVPFYLELFEVTIINLKNGTIQFNNKGDYYVLS